MNYLECLRTLPVKHKTKTCMLGVGLCIFVGVSNICSVALGADLRKYTIRYKICEDSQGPNCETLRLGDSYLSTDQPGNGYLYMCRAGNSSAPGSTTNKITWIDWDNASWNFLKKPWLPSGEFSPVKGYYREKVVGEKRVIKINNLPVDRKIGDWPMTQYSDLARIDRNPGTPSKAVFEFSLPTTPRIALRPTCVSLGAIGVTLNGVVLFNAVDARGDDAVAHEIVDVYGGHPARTVYHYHFVPEHLEPPALANGHSNQIGWIADGFPLHGYYGNGAKEMTNSALDECHGHSHASLGYHYHATIEYPYTIGCYRGTPHISKN